MSGRRFDVAVLAVVAAAYILVRIVIAPIDGFLRFHTTDLLAGVALPSLVALIFVRGTALGDWVRTFSGKIQMILAATVVWEGIVPLVSTRSTGDPIDALCYVCGTLVQHAAARALSPRGIGDAHGPGRYGVEHME